MGFPPSVGDNSQRSFLASMTDLILSAYYPARRALVVENGFTLAPTDAGGRWPASSFSSYPVSKRSVVNYCARHRASTVRQFSAIHAGRGAR
jgi:hypothetical protein